MVAIPFPASSSPGREPQDTAGRLTNVYGEQEGGNRIVFHRVPGMVRVVDTARVHCRGLHAGPSATLFVAYDDRLWSVTRSGTVWTASDRGALIGTTGVTFAQNNKSPTPDVVCVTSEGAFTLTVGGAPVSFPDPDLPQPNSVTFFGGYFIFTTRNGAIWATGLNDTTVDPVSFTRADQRSDFLLRGIAFGDQFFAFGQSSIEVYSNAGTTPFPLAFRGSIYRGLAAPFAVAGFEAGWSNELIWVADDGRIYRLSGYTPDPISTPSVERAIEDLPNRETLSACVYMAGGHAFWSLSSDRWTWVYDLTTKTWHERKSYGLNAWRGSCSVRFDEQWVVGDAINGALYTISRDYTLEHNDPIVCTLESDRVNAFPNRNVVARADFDFTFGVGSEIGLDPIQTDPRASISWSDDGGANWSSPLLREIGRQGQYGRRATVLRTGMAGPAGRKWRVSVSDSVPLSFRGGDMSGQLRLK